MRGVALRGPAAGGWLASLPVEIAALLRSAADAGGATATPVAWVGGGVRDLLLGRSLDPRDLDLVVEGALEPFVDELARRVEAERVGFSAFLTAEIELRGGGRIDVARARSETYGAPAALPRVAPADLDADLRRRDFTVNCMAIRLPESVGRSEPLLHDPLGGRADLGAGRLRVLHGDSFRDDPTRLYRGTEFEARLGLRFDGATEHAAVAAVADGVVDRLSGARLRAVLRRSFGRRSSMIAALTGAQRRGLVAAIDSALRFEPARAPWLERAAEWLELHAGERPLAPAGSPALLGLVLLFLALDLGEDSRRRIAARLGLDRGGSALLCERGPRLAAMRLDPDEPPSRLHARLDPLSEIELALLAARDPVAATVVARELIEWRSVRLTIDGDDLLTHGIAPGPGVGAALARTLEARIDGRIEAAAELRFALSQARSEA